LTICPKKRTISSGLRRPSVVTQSTRRGTSKLFQLTKCSRGFGRAEVTTARFLKPAEAEVDEAVAYFDEQRTGLADRFEQDLLATVNFVMDHPRSGKPLNERVRKARFRTFRYNLIYVIDEYEIVIVAVAHIGDAPVTGIVG
jgi:plasmid stabilization system protein ParE